MMKKLTALLLGALLAFAAHAQVTTNSSVTGVPGITTNSGVVAVTSGGTGVTTSAGSGSNILGDSTWTSVTFNAGNFTGNGSQTWTLASGDQSNFRYVTIGKTMIVHFELATTTVGGTPNTALQILIPNSKTAASAAAAAIVVKDAGGSETVGIAQVTAASTLIKLYRTNFTATNWSAATDTTSVIGEIAFEIQ
jgi:hypothetical protein